MAASIKSIKRSRTRRSHISEINVTPFVDVILVLLIIFMVTAPLLTVGVPVDLPKVDSKGISDNVEPLVITLQENGNIFLQETKIDIKGLVPKLIAITGEKPDTKIYIRADRKIEYGQVMQIMSHINASGFKKVALITELPKQKSKRIK